MYTSILTLVYMIYRFLSNNKIHIMVIYEQSLAYFIIYERKVYRRSIRIHHLD